MDTLPLTLPADLVDVQQTLERGGRITPEQAQALLAHDDVLALAAVADEITRRRWGSDVSYSRPTRVSLGRTCGDACAVCGPATTTPEQRALRAADDRPSELHLIGLPDDATLATVEALLSTLRARLPDTWLQGFGPRDLVRLARRDGQPVESAAARLQRAGLDGLLGAHEEVHTPVGRRLVPGDDPPGDAEREALAAAFATGLVGLATMTYRPDDPPAVIVSRLNEIRELQRGRSGFSAFAPLPADLEAGQLDREQPSGYEDMRIIAVSRLFLDNVPHIRVPWLALGLKMGQVALSFGADDLGWAPLDAHVRAHSPSTSFTSLSEGELARTVTAARRRAVPVDGAWRPLRVAAP